MNVCIRFFFYYVNCWGSDKLQDEKDNLFVALKFSEKLARVAYTEDAWSHVSIKDHRNMLLLAWGIGSPCSICFNVHPSNGIPCQPASTDESRLQEIFGEKIGKKCTGCQEDDFETFESLRNHFYLGDCTGKRSVEQLFMLGGAHVLKLHLSWIGD